MVQWQHARPQSWNPGFDSPCGNNRANPGGHPRRERREADKNSYHKCKWGGLPPWPPRRPPIGVSHRPFPLREGVKSNQALSRRGGLSTEHAGASKAPVFITPKDITHMETIRCKACGRELPPEAFRLVRGGGRGSTCRECCKERQLETRHRNADRGG